MDRKKWLGAVALSVLVFPGVGQLTLGRKKAGIIFIVLAILLLFGFSFSATKILIKFYSSFTNIDELLKFKVPLHKLLKVSIFAISFVVVWFINFVHILRCRFIDV